MYDDELVEIHMADPKGRMDKSWTNYRAGSISQASIVRDIVREGSGV